MPPPVPPLVKAKGKRKKEKQAAGHRLQATGYRLQATGCRLQEDGFGLRPECGCFLGLSGAVRKFDHIYRGASGAVGAGRTAFGRQAESPGVACPPVEQAQKGGQATHVRVNADVRPAPTRHVIVLVNKTTKPAEPEGYRLQAQLIRPIRLIGPIRPLRPACEWGATVGPACRLWPVACRLPPFFPFSFFLFTFYFSPRTTFPTDELIRPAARHRRPDRTRNRCR